jgi:PAS domain S-box-containing protein
MKLGGAGSGKRPQVRRPLGNTRSVEDPGLRSLKEMGCRLERASPDAILTADAKGTIIFCSQGAAKLLELLPGEAIGQNIGSFYKGGSAEASKILVQIESGESLRNCVTEMIASGGRHVPVSLAITPVRDRSGKIAGMICLVRDLTQMRRLENELADAERLAILGELSASLAHEIKNPLAGIKGAIDVIRDSPPSLPNGEGNNGLQLPAGGISLYNLERELIRQAMVRSGGNKTVAARLLKITRDTLRYKLKKYQLGQRDRHKEETS